MAKINFVKMATNSSRRIGIISHFQERKRYKKFYRYFRLSCLLSLLAAIFLYTRYIVEVISGLEYKPSSEETEIQNARLRYSVDNRDRDVDFAIQETILVSNVNDNLYGLKNSPLKKLPDFPIISLKNQCNETRR